MHRAGRSRRRRPPLRSLQIHRARADRFGRKVDNAEPGVKQLRLIRACGDGGQRDDTDALAIHLFHD